jgi:ABC-type transport system substrate-binding protein
MADAGYAGGFDLDIYIYTRPGLSEAPEIRENIASNWEKLGIRVTRKPVTYETYRSAFYANSFTKPTVGGFLYYANGPITAASFFTHESLSKLTLDPELEALNLAQSAASSRDEYIRVSREFQQQVLERAVSPPVFQTGEYWATRTDLKGPWDLGRGGYSININQLAAGK